MTKKAPGNTEDEKSSRTVDELENYDKIFALRKKDKNMASIGMMRTRVALGIACAFLAVSVSGCSYMGHRGRDAMDVADVGLLVSSKPQLALFINFWNLFPLGYADVDGKIIGIANGQAGVLDFVHKGTWGAVAWGAEQRGVAEGAEGVTGPVRYEQGFVRLLADEGRKPPVHQYFDCDRTFHLGWVGVHLRIKVDEVVDFLIGWSTVDIMRDDGLERGWPVEANPRWNDS